jgi:hypothetical protein
VFSTPRPHDALFKAAFETPAHAAALLRELLPAAIRDAIVWEGLKSEPASFVDRRLADHHCDLLFSARLRTGESASLFVLAEHQSTPDPTMPLRGLSYQVQLWKRSRKRHPGARLPPIIALVVSQWPGGWTMPRSLDEMLDPTAMSIPGMAALVPRFSLIIDDLSVLSDADLRARSLPAFPMLALWLLRDAHDPARYVDSFDAWKSTMLEAKQGPNGADNLAVLVNYMCQVAGPEDWDALHAKLRQLGPDAEEIAMTAAEALRNEGREEGRKEGRQEGREEGRQEGRQEGREEGRVATLRTLRSLILVKFKLRKLQPRYEKRLLAAEPERIECYFQRVLTADSLAAVFDDRDGVRR